MTNDEFKALKHGDKVLRLGADVTVTVIGRRIRDPYRVVVEYPDGATISYAADELTMPPLKIMMWANVYRHEEKYSAALHDSAKSARLYAARDDTIAIAVPVEIEVPR